MSRAASLRSSALRETALPSELAPTLDAKALDVTIRQGPPTLAGLQMQLEWQGTHMLLRLRSPSKVMSERLKREGPGLADALSAALGVDVALEVHHER
ncbi:hypothetical protein [Pandoraea sputorum]|uniref:hypothetical protein n=1 Tax=Pandoraea sputorum TaxID=93222 RepID=UPI00124145FF|nr:hypothetical protein [Pandoraea sputorum]